MPPVQKPINQQFDLTSISLAPNLTNPQPKANNLNFNLQNDLNSSAKKANQLMNPTSGNDEFDNFQTGEGQDNKKQPVSVNK